MPSDFAAALDAEIAALQAELDADPRFRKLVDLKRARVWYDDTQRSQSLVSHNGTGSSSVPSATPRRQSPARMQVLGAVRLYLRNRVHPVPIAELLEHLEGIGIIIGGAIPRNNLSAMLSNSGEFVSEGRSGWRLASAGQDDRYLSDEPEPIDFDSIATEFGLKMGVHRLQRVKEYIAAYRDLPDDIEDELVVTTESIVNRDLEPDERKNLKNEAIAIFDVML